MRYQTTNGNHNEELLRDFSRGDDWMAKSEGRLRLMAIDCCEHILAALNNVPRTDISSVASRNKSEIATHRPDVELIVIGVSQYPVRRLFISDLCRVYPDIPLLILRRDNSARGEGEEVVRGEFILSDRPGDDCRIVETIRQILPLAPCEHIYKERNYDTVREVIRVIASNYSDPNLDLERVARQLPISPARLSRILNQNVGVSFRQLLRHTRIEEAKRMLASHRFSVKEVAVRVGFSDSHYFSRSFKELTGLNASEYKAQNRIS